MSFVRGLRSQEGSKQRLRQNYRMAGSAQFGNNFALPGYVTITLSNVPSNHLKLCFPASHARIINTRRTSVNDLFRA
jgi:hypothetical protein